MTQTIAQKTIGDYVLLKVLGQGALGVLYLAEHRYMKKHYAVKILSEELASDRNFIARFEKEIENLSLLDHPNIVKVHNVGFHEGRYFFVTDCIVDAEGETRNLSQHMALSEKPLSEEAVFQIFIQVAMTLGWAHERLINEKPLTHKSLKLSNILIGQHDNKLKIFISDFGLTRIMGERELLSRSYQAMGEALSARPLPSTAGLYESFLQGVAFLAPEQKNIASERQNDVKVDIYALGVLAYYLLMNEFPQGVFDLPSTRRKDLLKNWDGFILHCLKNDPEKRPSSVAEALSILDHSLATASDNTNQLHFEGFFDAHKGLRPSLKPQEISRPEYEANPGAIFQIESVIAKYSPKAQEAKNIDPILTEMIVINGGDYHRGSSKGARDEMPIHLIKLSAFALDIHPVTNEQFVRFLEAMGGEKDGNNNDIVRLRESRIKRHAGKLSIESGYSKHPVVGVTWYGAIAYAKWIGKRLPTEAEWEVAAMGGSEGAVFPTGENIERSQANFFSSDTTAVMSYPSVGYGLYDMAGNVYEWCQDWYSYNYYEISVQEPENPKGPLQGVYRVLRGGCWKSLKEDLRVAHRHRNNPGTMNGTYGFRCAADVV